MLYRVYVSVRIESWFEFYIANPNVFGDLYLFFVSYTEEKYRINLTRIFSVKKYFFSSGLQQRRVNIKNGGAEDSN